MVLPSSLERILFNLLSNAFKYTDAGGCVTLEAHLDSGSRGHDCSHFSKKTRAEESRRTPSGKYSTATIRWKGKTTGKGSVWDLP